MENLDEQLEKATSRIEELEAAATESAAQIETLTAANAELADNLRDSQEKLASLQGEYQTAQTEIATLRAEAKTAEERAAEIYGAKASEPQPVTAQGDPGRSLVERFRAATTPAEQTKFLRSLSPQDREALFANL